jgi:hypothetical protein
MVDEMLVSNRHSLTACMPIKGNWPRKAAASLVTIFDPQTGWQLQTRFLFEDSFRDDRYCMYGGGQVLTAWRVAPLVLESFFDVKAG